MTRPRRVRRAQATAAAAGLLLLVGCMEKLPGAPSEVTSGVTIYEHANFKGISALLTRDVSSLADYEGPCEHTTYSGYPGGSTTVRNWAGCVSSLRVAPGWRATIYTSANFKGQSLEVTTDVSNLQLAPGSCDEGGLNDCISSIRVRQQ
jgi:hypothetical protein